jgi:hypothetical protein
MRMIASATSTLVAGRRCDHRLRLTIAFFVLALLTGLLLTGHRRLLFNKWLVFGGLTPRRSSRLSCGRRNGFPVVEYTANYSVENVPGDTGGVHPSASAHHGPLALPLWTEDCTSVLCTSRNRTGPLDGVLFLFVFFMLQKAKFYWLSPAYPALFAAGAYGLQRWIEARPRLGWMQPTYAGILAATGLLLAPFAIPILTPEDFIKLKALVEQAK